MESVIKAEVIKYYEKATEVYMVDKINKGIMKRLRRISNRVAEDIVDSLDITVIAKAVTGEKRRHVSVAVRIEDKSAKPYGQPSKTVRKPTKP